jgi:hypothetical protein
MRLWKDRAPQINVSIIQDEENVVGRNYVRPIDIPTETCSSSSFTRVASTKCASRMGEMADRVCLSTFHLHLCGVSIRFLHMGPERVWLHM